MTKKDFELLDTTINNLQYIDWIDKKTLNAVSTEIARAIKDKHPKFDVIRFLERCDKQD